MLTKERLCIIAVFLVAGFSLIAVGCGGNHHAKATSKIIKRCEDGPARLVKVTETKDSWSSRDETPFVRVTSSTIYCKDGTKIELKESE